jgi:hypothetical protein
MAPAGHNLDDTHVAEVEVGVRQDDGEFASANASAKQAAVSIHIDGAFASTSPATAAAVIRRINSAFASASPATAAAVSRRIHDALEDCTPAEELQNIMDFCAHDRKEAPL